MGHTKSYGAALKSVLRQDADGYLSAKSESGNRRGRLYIAESGPLVFSTLHTTDSMQTVERMINLFPTQQHKQIQIQIASTLKAAISQILPRAQTAKAWWRPAKSC